VGSGWLACRGPDDILSGLFRGPYLGWPHGVQQEDPAPWNSAARHPEPAAEAIEQRPRMARLAPHVGRGLAPKGRW
jgi:hypothetical protein